MHLLVFHGKTQGLYCPVDNDHISSATPVGLCHCVIPCFWYELYLNLPDVHIFLYQHVLILINKVLSVNKLSTV